MPRRDDLHTILIIGSGPIVIGQGCEFDYSGTQACKALREEGYRVVLVNSNPATIMTDPEIADRTYIEPITPEAVAKIIERSATRHAGRRAAADARRADRPELRRAQLADDGVLERVRRRDDRRDPRGHPPRRGPARSSRSVVESARAGRAPQRRRPHDGRGARRSSRRSGCRRSSARRTRSAASGGGFAYNLEEFEDDRPARARRLA